MDQNEHDAKLRAMHEQAAIIEARNQVYNSPEFRKLSLRTASLQSQMEGLFRQLYQACTQQSMLNNFEQYLELVEDAALLMATLDDTRAKAKALLESEGLVS